MGFDGVIPEEVSEPVAGLDEDTPKEGCSQRNYSGHRASLYDAKGEEKGP